MGGWIRGYTSTHFYFTIHFFLPSPEMLSYSMHNIATESGFSMAIAWYTLIIFYLRLEEFIEA